MRGGNEHGRRAYFIGREAVARVVEVSGSVSCPMAGRETAARDLVGAGHRRRNRRRRSHPSPLVAIAQVVVPLSELTSRSITVSMTIMKGGPTK
jgi:hypothetical protein